MTNQEEYSPLVTVYGYQEFFQLLWKHVKMATETRASSTIRSIFSSGILLSGCPGVGKSFLISSLAHQWTLQNESSTATTPVFQVQWTSLHHVWLRVEQEAVSIEDIAAWMLPIESTEASKESKETVTLLVLDDLHLLEQNDMDDNNNNNNGQQRALQTLQAAMIHLLDHIYQHNQTSTTNIVQILALSRDKAQLPPALTQVHRLECHYEMEPPSARQRKELLQQLLTSLLLDKIVEPKSNAVEPVPVSLWATWLSSVTPGCVASDLVQLCARAQLRAQARRHDCSMVEWKDLEYAARSAVPGQLQHLDVVAPPVYVVVDSAVVSQDNNPYQYWYAQHQQAWKSFAGYEKLQKRLFRTIVLPWRRVLEQDNSSSTTLPQKNESTFLAPPKGVVFYGPSGCGKTKAAMCLGASCGLPMIRVRAADLLDRWLGGSEAALRQYFQKARRAAPCVLFFDELDAVASNRATQDEDHSSTGGVMSRLLSTFLNEMDGISSSAGGGGVLVAACTNRMDRLDAALLRPGRLEEHIELALPTASDALEILRYHLFSANRSELDECDTREDQSGSELSPDTDSLDLKELVAHLVCKYQVNAALLEGLARETILRCIQRHSISNDDSCIDSSILPSVSGTDLQEALQTLHLVK